MTSAAAARLTSAVADLTFELLGGRQAAAHADELEALHAEVYADPPYSRERDAALFADRFRVQCRQPGFVLAEARHGGYLVGYASGMPLRPSTSWWRDLTTSMPEAITTEHPGRTFALTELLVRASWRRQGIAQSLHDLILAGLARGARDAHCPARGCPGADCLRPMGLAQSRADTRSPPRLAGVRCAGHHAPGVAPQECQWSRA